MTRLTTRLYAGVKPADRPPDASPLGVWLTKRGISVYSFARQIEADYKLCRLWATGRAIPGLIYAFKIDQATGGGVAPSMWIGTTIGQLQWRGAGIDWDKWTAQRDESSKAAKKKARASRPPAPPKMPASFQPFRARGLPKT